MLLVKLIAQVKLQVTKQHKSALLHTLHEANNACNAISEIAWESQTFGQYNLHKRAYRLMRDTFDLSAQVIVRCIAKVADAYKLDKATKRTFKLDGAIAFDDRILSWKTGQQIVSIWTIEGRQKISYLCGERQKRLLESRIGETDLVYRKGNFYLLAVCEVPEPSPADVDDVLGVDFGITKIATDSDGQSYDGEQVEAKRQRYAGRRAALQKVGTRSAKRKLRKMSGRQRRYQSDVNHCISKQLVRKAQDTNRSLAIEELKGIRARTTVRKSQRARHHNWAFRQLRTFVEYKAAVSGVRVLHVDPRNTSRTCAVCGHCEKGNRKSQSEFVCKLCHHSANADMNRGSQHSKTGHCQDAYGDEWLRHSVTSRRPLGRGT
ncbi:MAG: RNA-guided endonuclease InsQ/TnpB family protein [Pyrinomonadaceae bacterium]